MPFLLFLGITVEDQSQRYQFKNKELALQKLRTILFEIQQKSVEQATNELKKQQVHAIELFIVIS